MPLHLANLFTCPGMVPGNKCPDTGPSSANHSPGLWVLKLEHSPATKPSSMGAFSLHLIPFQGDPVPAAFPKLISARRLCSG